MIASTFLTALFFLKITAEDAMKTFQDKSYASHTQEVCETCGRKLAISDDYIAIAEILWPSFMSEIRQIIDEYVFDYCFEVVGPDKDPKLELKHNDPNVATQMKALLEAISQTIDTDAGWRWMEWMEGAWNGVAELRKIRLCSKCGV